MNDSCRASYNCGGQVAFVFRLPAGQVEFSGLFLTLWSISHHAFRSYGPLFMKIHLLKQYVTPLLNSFYQNFMKLVTLFNTIMYSSSQCLQFQNFWGSLMTPCLKIWGLLTNLEGQNFFMYNNFLFVHASIFKGI